MEALAAFSMVTGILQVLDVSSSAVEKYREIYKDGSVAAHRDTSIIAKALGTSMRCSGGLTLHASWKKQNIFWVMSRPARGTDEK